MKLSRRFAIFQRDLFTCQYCGRRAPDVVLEIDHIQPLSAGGSDEDWNLVTACFECNRGKRAYLAITRAGQGVREALECVDTGGLLYEEGQVWKALVVEIAGSFPHGIPRGPQPDDEYTYGMFWPGWKKRLEAVFLRVLNEKWEERWVEGDGPAWTPEDLVEQRMYWRLCRGRLWRLAEKCLEREGSDG